MVDIEVSAYMKASQEIFSKDIINLFRYSIKDYCPFILRVIVRKGKCGTMDKCHVKSCIREIRFLIFCILATGKPVLDVGSKTVAIVI